MKYTTTKVNLSASEVLGFPPSKPFNIKRLKRLAYCSIKNKSAFYNYNKGDFGMKITETYILSYSGFASAGVAAYAFFTNGNTNIAFAAAGASLLCFYGAFRNSMAELEAKNRQEDFDSVWSENNRLWDRTNELEDMIHNCVKKRDFEDLSRDNRSDIDAVYRHIDATNEENMRTLQAEVDGIHRRVDAVEDSVVTTCEAVCSSKRSK